jgi:hypothetical protein
MHRTLASSLLCSLIAIPVSSAAAVTPHECMREWTSADTNGNGVLAPDEPSAAYVEQAQRQGMKLKEAGALTRDEFMLLCMKEGFVTASPSRPANLPNQDRTPQLPADRGKGDLTPGQSPFSEAEARKRLEATGYKQLEGLRLDDKGVWRATANSGTQRVPVGLDAQGDIVSSSALDGPSSKE